MTSSLSFNYQFSPKFDSLHWGIVFCGLTLVPPQALRPRGRDVQQQELGDLVEQEMAATSSALEDAAARIEVWSGFREMRAMQWKKERMWKFCLFC